MLYQVQYVTCGIWLISLIFLVEFLLQIKVCSVRQELQMMVLLKCMKFTLHEHRVQYYTPQLIFPSKSGMSYISK